MGKAFTHMLSGGRPNFPGRTQEIVDAVLADQGRLDGLFAAIAGDDELLRLRVGDALETVCAFARIGSCRTLIEF